MSDSDYRIVETPSGDIYVHHGYSECGPFGSVKKAEKYIAKELTPQPLDKVLKIYNSKGQVTYDATAH